MTDINITIVNWKNKKDISTCLKSLFCDIKNSNLKIIIHVVDNSQNIDNIKEFLAKYYPLVKYIDPKKNIGFGRANNLGFKKDKARFYLALNPDIEFIRKNTIKKLVHFLEKNPKAGIVGPKLMNTDGSIQKSCYRFPGIFDQFYRRLNLNKKNKYFKKKVDNYLMNDFGRNKTIKVDWIMGAFMLVKSEVTKKIGFFDDRFFMYFEDCDWCRRAQLAGYKIYYMHNAIVRHAHKRESAKKHPLISIIINPITRIHLNSWIKYFWKWRITKKSKVHRVKNLSSA